jgi:hypothetical protein
LLDDDPADTTATATTTAIGTATAAVRGQGELAWYLCSSGLIGAVMKLLSSLTSVDKFSAASLGDEMTHHLLSSGIRVTTALCTYLRTNSDSLLVDYASPPLTITLSQLTSSRNYFSTASDTAEGNGDNISRVNPPRTHKYTKGRDIVLALKELHVADIQLLATKTLLDTIEVDGSPDSSIGLLTILADLVASLAEMSLADIVLIQQIPTESQVSS